MIRAWWDAQSARDRRVLAVGAVVAAVLLAWALVWYPLARHRADLAVQLDAARQGLATVRAGAAELERLRHAGGSPRIDRQGRSLLALADASAREAGLQNALRRVEPVGPRSVRVTFEFASFDTLMDWLEALSRDYGVQVGDLSADRVDSVGLVSARVTLEDAP